MVAGEKRKTKTKLNTVEPRYNEGPRDWQNLLTITKFFSIYFTITGIKKSFFIPRTSLYRGSTVMSSNELDETAYKEFMLRDPSSFV